MSANLMAMLGSDSDDDSDESGSDSSDSSDEDERDFAEVIKANQIENRVQTSNRKW
jgi:hypothetical protein